MAVGGSSAADHVEVNPDVISRRVDDEVVLVKLATNEIFALNPTGARIWELLSENGDVSDAVTRLSTEFDASVNDLRPQVNGFVAELQHQGFLITPG